MRSVLRFLEDSVLSLVMMVLVFIGLSILCTVVLLAIALCLALGVVLTPIVVLVGTVVTPYSVFNRKNI